MRGEILQGPVASADIVELPFRAAVAGGERLSWRTCLGVWLGLSVVSWGAVVAIATQLA